MIDIYLDGDDLKLSDTVVFKAQNILLIQEGSLEYEPDLGIDLKRFLSPDVKIQNETFESYSMSKLTEHGINTLELITNKETFREVFNYYVEDTTVDGLVQ